MTSVFANLISVELKYRKLWNWIKLKQINKNLHDFSGCLWRAIDTNESDKQRIGLPIRFDLQMRHNGFKSCKDERKISCNSVSLVIPNKIALKPWLMIQPHLWPIFTSSSRSCCADFSIVLLTFGPNGTKTTLFIFSCHSIHSISNISKNKGK